MKKGAVAPSVLIALVCGGSAQVPVSPVAGGTELQPVPERVTVPPALMLSDAGLREALAVHRNFDISRRARIDVYLSEGERFHGDSQPPQPGLEPARDASDPVPVMASMVPGGVLADQPKMPDGPEVLELDLGEEVKEFLGFGENRHELRTAKVNAPMNRPIPEPASVAALTVGFAGLVRVRLRKAGRIGSRRRR